ncbi:hypothetical protein Lepto7375DRAFT_3997 [Leptolyngbya sp. PCC 7375]|nr:hypothetical protein Lepto7375DRAFT_3997 [Leptolyngbya sp. PCC 7375]
MLYLNDVISAAQCIVGAAFRSNYRSHTHVPIQAFLEAFQKETQPLG